jgi:hypothetical protein
MFSTKRQKKLAFSLPYWRTHCNATPTVDALIHYTKYCQKSRIQKTNGCNFLTSYSRLNQLFSESLHVNNKETLTLYKKKLLTE